MNRDIGMRVLATSSVLVLFVGASCAERAEVSLEDAVGQPPPGSFVAAHEAGADSGELADLKPLELCIATECPAPYGTCADGLRCTTNFSNDPKNCGACGAECPTEFGYLNMRASCVDGACEPTCTSRLVTQGKGNSFFINFADCNKSVEDGCEIAITIDPNNCGGCGIKCPPGVRCMDGKCGCEAGKVDCKPGLLSGSCIDVRDDDDNCGACGNVCNTPPDAGAPPPHMYYGCRDNQCGQLKCVDYYSERWADCDNDRTNGCEVYVGSATGIIDPNHCGFCGNKCAPGQLCWDENTDWVPECGCKPNETMCGSLETSNLSCHDLLNDLRNCGSCFNACAVPGDHQIAACKKGVCELDCSPGWGDCDRDPQNGCETDLASTDAHCGACGNRCATQAGQPCIEGRCAMRECDAGGPK